MFMGSLARQRRQSALPTVLSRSQRGQRGVRAKPAICSLVRVAMDVRDSRIKSAAESGGSMGERIEFPSNNHTGQGYLATPEAGKGPAVVVIQEWWGLVPHIEDVANRFAAAGFLALAPDLFHGKTTKSPDEAGKMVMEMDADRAEHEIAAAGEHLLGRPECTSKSYGVVGFCMGGGLAQYTATKEDGKVGAAVSFYGGFKKVPFEWDNLTAPLLLICGEEDEGVTAEGREREKML